MELLSYDHTRAVLEELAEEIRRNYREHLMDEGHYTTLGNEVRLVDSITAKVTFNGQEFVGTLTMNDYWKYVEEDTAPHWPPRDAILRWVEIKPVIPRPDSRGRIPSPQQLAFLIGRKIAQTGTDGTHDLQKSKDAIIPFYVPKIQEALRQDLYEYITKYMDESVIDWE